MCLCKKTLSIQAKMPIIIIGLYMENMGLKPMIANNMTDDYEGRFIMCGEK